ncbi:MAG: 23S rRNA (guanosine(2251)-2'-O)-methyltransferase RlmB [Deltaproteobacteria bacterium]|nr:23S rRNA (guanosine(2251)-2'-O)-methyltransferase RlmB [Deltaproteobacteria bacterium]
MNVVYGFHPVSEALKHNHGNITRVIIAYGKKGAAEAGLVAAAGEWGIPVIYQDRKELSRLAGTEAHQGIVALGQDFRYIDLDDLISAKPIEAVSSLLILDCINDPHNLGSLIRTALCFGVGGIVIPKDRAVGVTPAVIKVSAGAAYQVPIAQVVNIAATIDRLKERGYWICGTDASGGRDAARMNLQGSLGIVLGGEHKGLRPLVKKKCDDILSIPMIGSLDSLNVAVAGAIVIYEVMRCRAGQGAVTEPQEPNRSIPVKR